MIADAGIAKVDRNRGWLRHGNPPFDVRQVKRCGARNRAGGSCGCPAMANGRCRLHGGKSTGPKTEEGKARIAARHRKHGRATNKAIAQRKAIAAARGKMKVLTFLARRGISLGMNPTQIDALLEGGIEKARSMVAR